MSEDALLASPSIQTLATVALADTALCDFRLHPPHFLPLFLSDWEKGWHVVHAVKSVHAWHSHHVLLVRDALLPQHARTGAMRGGTRSSALRRGATAMHSESLSRALQWFQTVGAQQSSPTACLQHQQQQQQPSKGEPS